MAEKQKRFVPKGPLAGREIDDRGRVKVWEKATAKWIDRDPLDARELVDRGLAFLEEPTGTETTAKDAKPEGKPGAAKSAAV